MTSDSPFAVLEDIKIGDGQDIEQQKKQKERLKEQRDEYEKNHDEVFRFLSEVKSKFTDAIFRSEQEITKEDITEFNNYIEHFEALSRNIEELNDKVRAEQDVNQIADYTEKWREIGEKMNRVAKKVEQLTGVKRGEIESMKINDESDGNDVDKSAEQQDEEMLNFFEDVEKSIDDVIDEESAKDDVIIDADDDGVLFGDKQSILKGVNSLFEQEREVVEQSITGIRQRFADIDKSDDKVVAQFWNDVSEEIKEDGGMTGPALAKVVNVVKANVESVDSSEDEVEEREQKQEDESVEDLLNRFDAVIDLINTKYSKNKKINNIANTTKGKINSDRGILKMKNANKKERAEKKMRTYVVAVIGQLEEEMQRVDAFRSLVREFGRTGKIYHSADGNIEINKYNVQEEKQVIYIQNDKKHTVSVSDFRVLIADIKKSKNVEKRNTGEISAFYDEVVQDAKENHSKNNAQIKDLLIDMNRQLKVKRQEIDRETSKAGERAMVAEFLTLKETLAQNLKNIINEKIVIETDREEKNIARKSSELTSDEKKDVAASDSKKTAEQQYESVGVQESVNFIFDTEEIQGYIGTGKSKETRERQKRINTYKKEIIEGITEIEGAAGRKINHKQFAIEYALSKRATVIAEILKNTVREVYTDEQLEEIQKTRDAANITFTQMDKYREDVDRLNADTEHSGDEKFKEVTREVWREFAVRGYVNKNKETGKFEVTQHKNEKFDLPTNTDGRMALRLLEMAGISIDDVTYVAPGEYDAGKINIDTGKKDGLIILEDGTVIIDHHGEDSLQDTSGTEVTYDILVRLGLLEKTESVDNLVAFVNQVDNLDYPDQENYFNNYFKNSWKTVLGTYRQMKSEKIVEFFKYGENEGQKRLSPTETLSPGLIGKFGLDKKQNPWDKLSITKKQEKFALKKLENLEEMEKNGFIVESSRYGKICIDIVSENGQSRVNNDSARAFGCDTYIIWNKADEHFFMSSLVGKEIEDDFAQGEKIRGTMCIKPKGTDEKLIRLEDILNKMTDGKLKASEKLQKVLDTNGERVRHVELTRKEERYIIAHIERAKENIAFVNSMDFSDLTKKVQIKKEKASLIDTVWERLEEDIKKTMRFTSGQSQDIVNLIKDKL